MAFKVEPMTNGQKDKVYEWLKEKMIDWEYEQFPNRFKIKFDGREVVLRGRY